MYSLANKAGVSTFFHSGTLFLYEGKAEGIKKTFTNQQNLFTVRGALMLGSVKTVMAFITINITLNLHVSIQLVVNDIYGGLLRAKINKTIFLQ